MVLCIQLFHPAIHIPDAIEILDCSIRPYRNAREILLQHVSIGKNERYENRYNQQQNRSHRKNHITSDQFSKQASSSCAFFHKLSFSSLYPNPLTVLIRFGFSSILFLRLLICTITVLSSPR